MLHILCNPILFVYLQPQKELKKLWIIRLLSRLTSRKNCSVTSIAIAKEESVQQITASAFLKHHKIGTPSVSRRLADALCEKGLLNDDSTLEGTVYSISDVFLSHWMERL